MISMYELTSVAQVEGRKFYAEVVAAGHGDAVVACDPRTAVARAVELCGKPEYPAEVAEYLNAHPGMAGTYEAMFSLGFDTARLCRA